MAVSWMNPGPMAINLAYDGITQKCWCLVRSPCLRNFLPQAQLSVLNSDCLLAEQCSITWMLKFSLHHLNTDETTPSCPGTTHTIYHTHQLPANPLSEHPSTSSLPVAWSLHVKLPKQQSIWKPFFIHATYMTQPS